MKSPIARIRGELGLSQSDLARLAGEHTSSNQMESGLRKPSQRLLKILEELGYDPLKVKYEQQAFVETRRAMELQQLKARVA